MKDIHTKKEAGKAPNLTSSPEGWFINQSPLVRTLTLLIIIAVIVFFYLLVWWTNKTFSVERPKYSGSVTEGIIGIPRHINPILATSNAESDLSTLIYQGLFSTNGSGAVTPLVAQSYTLDDTETIYTIKLRQDVFFHDGTQLTTRDVAYTIEKILDPDIASPKRGDFVGVEVEVLNDFTMRLTLPKPHAPFLSNLDVGIIPSHLWKDVTDDEFYFHPLNLQPIGSGPYAFSKIEYNETIPHKHTFTPSKYFSPRPYLNSISVVYFSNEDDRLNAFLNEEIHCIAGLSASNIPLKRNTKIITWPMTRSFGVFFNQNKIPDSNVRKALNASLQRDRIIANALKGYGLTPPAPWDKTVLTDTIDPDVLLVDSGYTKNETTGFYEKDETVLTVELSVPEIPDLLAVAETVVSSWENLGVKTTLRTYPLDELSWNILRPRDYSAILFGMAGNLSSDPYPFFHSSERNDPGLNFALYTNADVDDKLEELRETVDSDRRMELLEAATEYIADDSPVAMLFVPEAIYVVPAKLNNVKINDSMSLSDRFKNTQQWYTETERVLKLFGN